MHEMKPMNPYFYRPQHNYAHLMPFIQNGIPPRSICASGFTHGLFDNNVTDEEDLASISIQIDKKRFYVDVKKNRKGKFMKIAEVGLDGRKARLILTMQAAAEMKEKLKDLLNKLEEVQSKEDDESCADSGNQGEQKSDSGMQDGLIKSHTLVFQKRRYFLDLKHNRRGFFLRMTMMTSYMRVQLAMPSEGMQKLYDAISSLLEKWYDAALRSQEQQIDLPQSRSLRIDNKSMYFDSFVNRFGVFLRISEVRPTYRTSIAIPARYISRFQDVIDELSKELVKKDQEFQTTSTEENVEQMFPSTEGNETDELVVCNQENHDVAVNANGI